MIVEKVKKYVKKQAVVTKASKTPAVPKSATVVDFYADTYPYVFSVPLHCGNNEYWSTFPDQLTGVQALANWCDSQHFSQTRWDFHRVTLQCDLAVDGHESSAYVIDENGTDVIFFAFTNHQDFTWFCSRWGHVAT